MPTPGWKSQAGNRPAFFEWRKKPPRDALANVNLAAYDNSDFQRGAPFWKEVLWWVARSLLFSSWFPLPSRLRCDALRFFGAKIGQGVVIRSRVNVTFPWRLEIGDHVWIGEEVLILSLARVKIGSHVCISQRAFLCTGSHDTNSEAFRLQTSAIEIGDECWIAAGTFIGAGVTIGHRTICSAGSVILRGVGPDVVAFGNPCQTRPRHSDQRGKA